MNSPTTYTIAHSEHGIAVFGPIPVGDFQHLGDLAAEHGYDLCDAVVTQLLRGADAHLDMHLPHPCSVVFTSEESGLKWRQELRDQLDNFLRTEVMEDIND